VRNFQKCRTAALGLKQKWFRRKEKFTVFMGYECVTETGLAKDHEQSYHDENCSKLKTSETRAFNECGCALLGSSKNEDQLMFLLDN